MKISGTNLQFGFSRRTRIGYALGRTTKRTDVHAGKTLTTSWTWDTAPHGIGVLHMLTSPDAIKTYSYSARGQVEKEMLSVAGDSFASTLDYDELDRLTCAYFAATESPGATCATAYGYAPNGNLTTKSDIGTLSYADPNHPNAVTNAPGSVFTYDAVGNQIGRPGRVTITYAPFDLPETVKKNGKTTSLGYDGDQQRIRKTSGNTETLYFEDLFEQVTSGNAQEFRYYVHSPERVIAVVTRGSANAGTNYLHADHLGSVESVTNANGEVVEKRSYDAFGARRNPQWGTSGGVTSGLVAKGFTGHDEEDEFGLINMKGRLYDPKIARFTTTDPVISNVWNGQTINPFSYVHNNPLAFVDPSGFSEEEAWRLWHYNETPGQLGVHVTYDQLKPPGPSPAPTAPADVNASAPTNDVGTTGDGNEATPEPIPAPGFWDGVGNGIVNTLEHADEMIPGSFANIRSTIPTGYEIVEAYQEGGPTRAINVINPAMPLVNVIVGVEEGDWYKVGENAVGVAVTVVAVIAAKKLGPKMGPMSARGPPGERINTSNTRLPSPEKKQAIRDANRIQHQGKLTCEHCGRDDLIDPPKARGGQPKPANQAEVDHIKRRSEGGGNEPDNLRVLCSSCNAARER